MHGQEEIIVQIENMLRENHSGDRLEDQYKVSANFVMTVFLKMFHHHAWSNDFLRELKYMIDKRLSVVKDIPKTYSRM